MPNLWCLNGLVWLLPKVDFSKFVIVPAVADDTVLAWLFAGKVVGLRGASYRRKRRVNQRRLTEREELADSRGVLADEPSGQAHDIEDSSSFHGGGRIQAWAGMTDCSRPA